MDEVRRLKKASRPFKLGLAARYREQLAHYREQPW
ncbi:uncharacterized protein G2W53_027056 [Senna tora]|uniref:Uncharacterized protein n=1 Tax=Senna tora TaxID=362788 RepID=A0A834WJD9_9FABA|nr:uncharacterized protein G2W53_027056 [Senna tora]